MIALFNDFIQLSDAPDTLKSPALADITSFTTLTITLDQVRTFDHIGIGNTTAATVDVNGDVVTLGTGDDLNGLYALSAAQTTDTVVITFPALVSVGRIALGVGRKLGAAPAREPGFWSTNVPRRTLSGQVIQGVGGVTGRILSVDFRYKVTREIFDDIQEAYPTQLGRGFPVFLSFPTTSEQNRFPWVRFYGTPELKWVFQSSVNRFAYSKKLKFEEAY